MLDLLADGCEAILNTLLEFLYYIMDFLFGWISLPSMPDSLVDSIDSFFNLLFDNLSLLSIFVRIETLQILSTLVILLFSFKYTYKITMWLIKKIPFINIQD